MFFRFSAFSPRFRGRQDSIIDTASAVVATGSTHVSAAALLNAALAAAVVQQETRAFFRDRAENVDQDAIHHHNRILRFVRKTRCSKEPAIEKIEPPVRAWSSVLRWGRRGRLPQLRLKSRRSERRFRQRQPPKDAITVQPDPALVSRSRQLIDEGRGTAHRRRTRVSPRFRRVSRPNWERSPATESVQSVQHGMAAPSAWQASHRLISP